MSVINFQSCKVRKGQYLQPRPNSGQAPWASYEQRQEISPLGGKN